MAVAPVAEAPVCRRGAVEALRAELKAAGLLARNTGRVVAELVLHLAVAATALVVFVRVGSLPVRALAILVATVATLGIATNTHTASHGAASDRRWVNDALAFFGYPLVLGLSLTSWRQTHIAVHHRAPNVIGVDGDCDLMPWFALTRPELDGAPPHLRPYYRWQWLVLPVLIALDGYNRVYGSCSWLARALLDGKRRERAHVIDAACILGHATLWLVVPCFFFPVLHVLGFYALRISLLSYGLFAAFAPGHYPAVAEAVTPAARSNDFFRRQLATTVNFRTGPIGRLVCSGLDYQIEHHLFPAVSHDNYPAISARVVAFCERHGYPYHSMGWGESLWATWRVFMHPKPVRTEPAADENID